MPGQVSWSQRLQSEPACNGRFGQQSSKSINDAPPPPSALRFRMFGTNRSHAGRLFSTFGASRAFRHGDADLCHDNVRACLV
jgi:hypothetical protein